MFVHIFKLREFSSSSWIKLADVSSQKIFHYSEGFVPQCSASFRPSFSPSLLVHPPCLCICFLTAVASSVTQHLHFPGSLLRSPPALAADATFPRDPNLHLHNYSSFSSSSFFKHTEDRNSPVSTATHGNIYPRHTAAPWTSN